MKEKLNNIQRLVASLVGFVLMVPNVLYGESFYGRQDSSGTAYSKIRQLCSSSTTTVSTVAGVHARCVDATSSGGRYVPSRYYQYDQNGSLEFVKDVTYSGSTPILTPVQTHTFSVNRKLKSAKVGSSEILYFYTTTGEKVATSHVGQESTEVFTGDVRFTNDVPRYTYSGDVETTADGSGCDYFVRDHLGSVVATVASNSVLERKDALPFGESWYTDSFSATDRDFNGNFKEGSLLDYNARHYNPATGVFVTADSVVPSPIGALSSNRHAYTFNNPLNYRDDTGHFPVLAALMAVNAVANVVQNRDRIQNFGQFIGSAIQGAAQVPAYAVAGPIGGAALSTGITAVGESVMFGNNMSAQHIGVSFGANVAGSVVSQGIAPSAKATFHIPGDGFNSSAIFSASPLKQGLGAAMGSLARSAIYSGAGYQTSFGDAVLGFTSSFASTSAGASMKNTVGGEIASTGTSLALSGFRSNRSYRRGRSSYGRFNTSIQSSYGPQLQFHSASSHTASFNQSQISQTSTSTASNQTQALAVDLKGLSR